MPAPRRYLALYLPWIPAERAIRDGIAPPDAAFVLTARLKNALRVAALSPAAAALGLEVGLPLADARARVPGLAALEHDATADAALLDRFAASCVAWSPSVACDPPQGLTIDITGCAHLHGGEAAMARAIVAHANTGGLTACVAIADTPDAARALARHGGGNDVKVLPIEALAAPPDVIAALRRAGFRSIGALAAVPRGPIAARFGAETVRLLARLLGEEDPHVVALRTEEPVEVVRRFAEPIGRTDHVLEVIGGLAEETARLLAERGEGGRAFAVRLHRSDGHVARLVVETGAPTRDPALLLRLLRERIDSLADPLDPGFGYDAVDLSVPVAEPLAERQERLASGGNRATREGTKGAVGALLDRLAVRHGARRLVRFAMRDSHVPERASGLLPYAGPSSPIPWPSSDPGEPPLRPLLLLDPPQPVEVLAAVPDGPPRRFRWRGQSHRIVAEEGPERIAPEWWRRDGGYHPGTGLTRDYYRVEDEAGHRFWMFRHGLYDRETGGPRWYVHGFFA